MLGNIDKDLLMYMLAGVGGSLGGKGSWQEALGGMTQQSMASKNMMQLLGKMLGGELVPGSSMKMSDKGDMSISVPKTALQTAGEQGLENAQQGSQLPGGSGMQWDKSNIPKMFNPFL